MKDKRLKFAVRDTILDAEASPSNVTLPLLAEFVDQVTSFLRGSRRTNLNEIKTSIEKSSFALVVEDEVGQLEDAYSDFEKIKSTKSLVGVDPVRAKVVLGWQQAVKENNERTYSLGLGLDLSDDLDDLLAIDRDSEFELPKETWVDVEQYMYGKVFDMGGKSTPNVHLELENGKSIKIGTKADVLIEDNQNRLYRKQLVRIRAKKNLDTGELKGERLISFEYYNPKFDEKSFEAISTKAREAWKSVKDVNKWVEDIRGSNV